MKQPPALPQAGERICCQRDVHGSEAVPKCSHHCAVWKVVAEGVISPRTTDARGVGSKRALWQSANSTVLQH